MLDPLLFLIYINDLIESCGTNSEIYLFADDAKSFRHILDVSDNKFLQGELHNLKDWTDMWLLRLNVKKCKVASFGRMVDNSYSYHLVDKDQSIYLDRCTQFKDLSVLMDEQLNFKEHIHEKINKAYAMLGIIRRDFKYLTISCFVTLYKGMVRSHLEYCGSV